MVMMIMTDMMMMMMITTTSTTTIRGRLTLVIEDPKQTKTEIVFREHTNDVDAGDNVAIPDDDDHR